MEHEMLTDIKLIRKERETSRKIGMIAFMFVIALTLPSIILNTSNININSIIILLMGISILGYNKMMYWDTIIRGYK